MEGATPSTAATKANLDKWIADTKIPFTIGIDPPDAPFRTRSTLGDKDATFIVELATMKIVYRTTNYQNAITKLDSL